MEYASLKDQQGANITLKELGLQTDLGVYLQIRQTWLAFSESCMQILKRSPTAASALIGRRAMSAP